MKRLMIIAAIMSLLGLVSCEKMSDNAIVGTWEATTFAYNMEGMNVSFDLDDMGIEMTMSFKRNGTGEIYMYAQGESEKDTFEYETIGNILYMYADGETEEIPYNVSKNVLTLTMSEGFIDDTEAKVQIKFKKK